MNLSNSVSSTLTLGYLVSAVVHGLILMVNEYSLKRGIDGLLSVICRVT